MLSCISCYVPCMLFLYIHPLLNLQVENYAKILRVLGGDLTANTTFDCSGHRLCCTVNLDSTSAYGIPSFYSVCGFDGQGGEEGRGASCHRQVSWWFCSLARLNAGLTEAVRQGNAWPSQWWPTTVSVYKSRYFSLQATEDDWLTTGLWGIITDISCLSPSFWGLTKSLHVTFEFLPTTKETLKKKSINYLIDTWKGVTFKNNL